MGWSKCVFSTVTNTKMEWKETEGQTNINIKQIYNYEQCDPQQNPGWTQIYMIFFKKQAPSVGINLWIEVLCVDDQWISQRRFTFLHKVCPWINIQVFSSAYIINRMPKWHQELVVNNVEVHNRKKNMKLVARKAKLCFWSSIVHSFIHLYDSL